MPLVTALSAATPTAASFAFALAAVALFLAHEPLLVVLGQRGARALREDGLRARRRLLGLALLGAVSGGVGLVLSPPARSVTLLPLALALALGALIARRTERSTAGESLAAAALASAGVPVMVASGLGAYTALHAWSVWAVGFALVTAAVRTVLAHARAPLSLFRRLLRLLPALVGGLVFTGCTPAWSARAAMPFVLAAVMLVLAPPAPGQLRRVGWCLVAASLLTASMLTASLRLLRAV